MNQPQDPSRSRPLRRRVLWVMAVAAAAALVAALLAPTFVPSYLVRRRAENMLGERLGRAVTVESAAFAWGRGLTCTGLRVRRRDGPKDALLARAKRLSVRLGTTNIPHALLGADVPPQALRVEGLELWLVRDEGGRWNVDDLEAVRCRSVEITDATIHLEKADLPGGVTLTGVHAKIGEIVTTGQGYVTVTADLPGVRADGGDETPGRLTFTASLNSTDLGRPQDLTGSLKAEWSGVAWPKALAALVSDPRLLNAARETSGRMSATFGGGSWQAEGAIEVSRATPPVHTDPAPLLVGSIRTRPQQGRMPYGTRAGPSKDRPDFPGAILGFQLRQDAKDQPIQVNLAKFSAPGVDLLLTGKVGPFAQSFAPGGDQEPPVPGPPDPLTRVPADLRVTGSLAWLPLARNVALLQAEAERFERLDGGANLNLHFVTTPDGRRVTGSVDLSRTLAVWPGVVRKERTGTLRLDVAATLSPDFSTVRLERAQLVTEAGRISATGRLPLARPTREDTHEADGAVIDLAADIKDAQALRALIPALDAMLGHLETKGPLLARLALSEQPSGDGPATWEARIQADLTPTHLTAPNGANKPAKTPATLEALALVVPEAKLVDVSRAAAKVGRTVLRWRGTCRLWKSRPSGKAVDPEKRRAARVDGTLTVRAIEEAGRMLVPGVFARDPPPLAGDVILHVDAELQDEQLTGGLRADLKQATLRIQDYFQKPAGDIAAVDISGRWHIGATHRLEGEVQVRLPGLVLAATGQGDVTLRTPSPHNVSENENETPTSGLLSIKFRPEDRINVRADVSDLKAVLAGTDAFGAGRLSPLGAERLEGYTAEGKAVVTAQFSIPKRFLHVGGSVDLTDASLDLGRLLKKAEGTVLRADFSADLLPPGDPSGGAIRLRLTGLTARLAESVTRLEGEVELVPPASPEGLRSAARIVPFLREADLKVHTKWIHNKVLREALPWLSALYAQCGLEGLTELEAELSGSPFQGTLRVDLEATECRIHQAGTTIKPAGTPASLRLEARYGEVPGELLLDMLEVKLGDAVASAAGQLLFDNPNLSTLAPPTTWALRTDGRIPDLRTLRALAPEGLRSMKPAGGVTFRIKAAADPFAAGIEQCDLRFDGARLDWLGKPVRLQGPIVYDGRRLAIEGLHMVVGQSDITLVAYVTRPTDAPAGTLLVRGKALALQEVQDLVQRTSERLASWAEAAGAVRKRGTPSPILPSLSRRDPFQQGSERTPSAPAAASTAPNGHGVSFFPRDLSGRLARRLQILLSRAHVTGDIELEHVALAVPHWNTTYDLSDLAAECRLAGRRFVVPNFRCTLNDGTIRGEVVLDFRSAVPLLSVAYDARDLIVRDNLMPLVARTFPGMQVTTLTQRETLRQRLAEGAHRVGSGETICTDGILEGPAAPEYITHVLPGLKLTRYRFRKMTNLFEHKENGDIENRMIFDNSYDIYIFGVTHADGQVDYTLGVDLSVGLQSQAWSRTLDQGKLPLLYYTGRIVGSKWAERNIRYVLPHEFAYDVFVKRNLVYQVLRRIGRKPPEIRRPAVVPRPLDRRKPES